MPKIILNNFKGIAPRGVIAVSANNLKRGPAGSFSGAQAIDPLYLPGVLTPGPGLTLLTNSATVSKNIIVRFRFYDTTAGLVYGLENRSNSVDSQLQEISVASDAMTNNATFPHTIVAAGVHGAHTAFAGEDLIFFDLAGTKYLFYAYNDNTDGDIGRYNLTATFVENYLSGTATGGAALGLFPHPMVEGDNGFLYIADGKDIHKLDGSTAAGIFTASVIDLPSGWVINDMVNNKGFLWILANRRISSNAQTLADRDVAVFIWNYLSVQAGNTTGFTQIIPLEEDSFGYKIFIEKNKTHVISVSPGRTRLRRWNGSEFTIELDLPVASLVPVLGGVSTYQNQTLWGGGSGLITFGRADPGDPELVNYLTGNGSSGTLGAIIKSLSDFEFYVSDGSRVYTTTGYGATPQFLSLVTELPYMSRLTRINILYPPVSGGSASSTIEVQIFKNLSPSATYTNSATHNLSADGAKGWISIPLNIDKCHAFKFFLLQNLLAADATAARAFAPYRIEVEYEPTTRKF